MTALSFVWVHPYSQNSGCDIYKEVLKEGLYSKYLHKLCKLGTKYLKLPHQPR